MTHLNTENGGKPYSTTIPLEKGQFLLNNEAIICGQITIGGVLYQPNTTSIGNSNAIFFPTPQSEGVPGRIDQIINHSRKVLERDGKSSFIEETFLVMYCLVPLSTRDIPRDNHRKFPITGGSLYYDRYDPNPCVIRPLDIKCHFSKTNKISISTMESCCHVLPLDRVSLYLPASMIISSKAPTSSSS